MKAKLHPVGCNELLGCLRVESFNEISFYQPEQLNVRYSTLLSAKVIGNAESRCIHLNNIARANQRSSPTPELTGRHRPKQAFKTR